MSGEENHLLVPSYNFCAKFVSMMPDLTGQKLKDALTLTRLAQSSKSPEMINQHLEEIGRILEYLSGIEAHHGEVKA